MALCKNAHWLFDNGLWTLSDDFTVIVAASESSEDSPDQTSLAGYHGRRLRLPEDRSYWPNLTNLTWHRKSRFRGTA